jgi:hypothetical protein
VIPSAERRSTARRREQAVCLLRAFGLAIPAGANEARPAMEAALEDAGTELPMALRDTLAALPDEVAASAAAMLAIEHVFELACSDAEHRISAGKPPARGLFAGRTDRHVPQRGRWPGPSNGVCR